MLQLFCRDLWNSRHVIRVSVVHIDTALIFILPVFLLSFFLYNVVVPFFLLHSPKTLARPFRDVMISPFHSLSW